MSEEHSGLTRRALLSATAAASLASAQSNVAKSTNANSAVSVALIGCGGRGRNLMRDLVSNTDARLSAVCDLRPERMEQARAEAIERGETPAMNPSMASVLAYDVDGVIRQVSFLLGEDGHGVTRVSVNREEPLISPVYAERRLFEKVAEAQKREEKKAAKLKKRLDLER